MRKAQPSAVEINRGYLDHFRHFTGAGGFKARLRDRLVYGRPAQLLFLPLVPLVAMLVGVRLLVWRTFASRRPLPDLHREALPLVDEFVDQYPLHLYPVVAKSLELAFLKARIDKLVAGSTRALELAVGDGTLSRRVFGPAQTITGLDLSPLDLVKAQRFPHVQRAVVGDALNPPFAPGSFDLLIANNFLHHVTQKRLALSNWKRLASTLMFTENTRRWATGWTVPFVLRRLGLARQADDVAMTIERRSLQCLLPVDEIVGQVESVCPVTEQQSFLSERTFFLCSVFSFSLRCFGPPTPAIFKRIALGPFRPFAIPMTRWIAKRLIEFDAEQDRRHDTFLQFTCKGDGAQPPGPVESDVICPTCQVRLSASFHCATCHETYPVRDGLLFVLPAALRNILNDYEARRTETIPDEHL